jgi:hypothetical protein
MLELLTHTATARQKMRSRKPEDEFSQEEAARRRDEVVRRMANTPPQPKITTRHPSKRKKKAGADRAAGKGRAHHEG